jgi:hypothetical protein
MALVVLLLVPVGQAEAKDMKLKIDSVHVKANRTDGRFVVKCEVINKQGGARTEFVKIIPVSGVQNVQVDFPQVQSNEVEAVEVKASGMLPPGVDEGVFIWSLSYRAQAVSLVDLHLASPCERRGEAGPVRGLLGGRTAPATFVQTTLETTDAMPSARPRPNSCAYRSPLAGRAP